MNTEETQIYEFLKKRGGNYVSVIDISKFLDPGRRFHRDRNFARPILRRMEVDGIVECNLYGEYRVKGGETESETELSDFKEALRKPGASLGDTTIIRISDV